MIDAPSKAEHEADMESRREGARRVIGRFIAKDYNERFTYPLDHSIHWSTSFN